MSKPPLDILTGLSTSQVHLIRQIAASLRVPVSATIATDSDLVNGQFAEDFCNRLVLYHALNEDSLKKKTFEFAFAGANRAAGRSASVFPNSTHAGHDVEVNGVGFSCKTEASKEIKRNTATISKLMEARWIRECLTAAHFCDQVKQRIVSHLKQYQRIVMLRAFKLTSEHYEYHLIEIPVELLLRVGQLEERDFSARTTNGSSSADIELNGQRAFTLRLDGSVEKVTISSLSVGLCKRHAVWTVPIGSPESLV